MVYNSNDVFSPSKSVCAMVGMLACHVAGVRKAVVKLKVKSADELCVYFEVPVDDGGVYSKSVDVNLHGLDAVKELEALDREVLRYV